MPSIFSAADRQALISRVSSLGPESTRQWGRMSPAQAFKHCQVGLRIALGETRLRRNLMGVLFGWWAKRQLLGPREFGRNLPTAPEFRVEEPCELLREQGELVRLIKKLGEGGPMALTRQAHPFFGELSAEEWDALQWKHLDHHLRQFGS